MIRKALTAGEIAQYCSVATRTVREWINEGKIDAFLTPGNHSRVKRENFLKFLEEYNIPIPDELKKDDGKKRILIVDDDEAMVSSIKRLLSIQKKYEIDVAYDGFVAGQKFISNKPDLIILDIRMPRVDGYQLCTAIRGDPQNNNIKILVVSGVVDVEGSKKIINLGANDFLSKPFDNKELKLKIERLLDIRTDTE